VKEQKGLGRKRKKKEGKGGKRRKGKKIKLFYLHL